MSKYNLLIPTDYDWLKKLNPETLLDVRDVIQVIGYKKTNGSKGISSSIKQGDIPKEDIILISYNGIKKRHWKVSTILKEIDRRINL